MTPLTETRALVRIFKGKRRNFGRRSDPIYALDGVDLAVKPGCNLGIVGESGCGKSTLARLVMVLDHPTAGEVFHHGRSVSTMSSLELKGLRSHFQLVFQDPFDSLDPHWRVGKSVADPLLALGKDTDKSTIRERVEETLSAVSLEKKAANRYPHEFSGGQRQRIAIARAIITRPKLIVADEPVSALDVSIQAQVLNLLLDLHESYDITYLFISHDLAVVAHIAKEVAVMYRGRIVEKGPVAEVFEKPYHPYTRMLIESIAGPSRLRLARKNVPNSISLSAGRFCLFLPRCQIATDRCHFEQPKLRPVDSLRFIACHKVR